MKRYAILISVLFFLILSVCHAAEYREGYLLVKFTETGTSSAANAARQAVVAAAGGGTIQKMYTIVPGLGLIKLPDGANTMTARAAFSAAVGVTYAEPDYIQRKQQIPNDTQFNSLWGMHNTGQTGGTPDADIDAPEAWDLGTGSSNVIVAVIDTGVDYTHPDLAANMWTNTRELNGTTGVDDDNNGYIDDIYGYDFVNSDGDPMDDDDHGTHVSGTIGGVGNNGQGVAGVCWNVRIMALKFLDPLFGGFTSDAISCIQYAIQMDATLTNNSWGGGGFSQALYDAIAAAGAADQLFVAAAGNDAMDNDQFPAYPASYDLDNIISVMSTTSTDARSSFSNWGLTSVDLAAPGSSILSAAPGGGYQYMSGTSMACPHVSGACALVLSVNPTLTAIEVKNLLMTTVDAKSALQGLSVTGGRLNLQSAIIAAKPEDTTPPSPDPMEWKTVPVAVGLQTIYMEAAAAQDTSGVEYYFDCLTDNTFDGNWQDSPVYYRGGYAQGTLYQFQVIARDKSENQNQTQPSVIGETTTASGTDNLPPSPDPEQWKGTPRKISNSRIAMEGAIGYDEIGTAVQYYYECVSTTDPAYPDPSVLSSGWVTTSLYQRSGLSVGSPGNEYVFRVKMRDAAGNETDWSEQAWVILAPPPVIREVPYPYATIQAAIDAANHGDTIRVHQGTHYESNIDFKGKKVTVRSEDPEDPAIVAATIIDCGGNLAANQSHGPARAFIFQSGEGRDSIVAGFTIQDAFAVDNPQLRPTPNLPDGSDFSGVDALGGAILGGVIEFDANGWTILNTHTPASPTIRNCVFKNCYAYGMDGTHGLDEVPAAVDTPGLNGGPGQDGGHGFGGAIYFVDGSAPLIKECQIMNCYAIGGIGGDGGDGGTGGDGGDAAPGQPGGNGGRGGWGGNAWGGAMYFEDGCVPELYDIEISDCYARVGEPGSGGNGGNGGKAGNNGGPGGNGGIGGDAGDLRAPDIAAGAIYCGLNTQLTMVRSEIRNCHTDADISGQYFGGNGGNGGDGNGDGAPGGNGGNGGVCWTTVGNWWNSIGGAWAAGGNGGNGGAGGTNGTAGMGGNGGDGGDAGGLAGTGTPTGIDGIPYVNEGNLLHLRTYGGANYYGGTSSVTATDCVIENNYSFTDNGGGEYFSLQGSGVYTNCTIQGNMTFYQNDNGWFYRGDGGGVYALDPGEFQYVDCTISTNQATNGAGIYFDMQTPGSKLDLTGCTFTANEANVNYQTSWGGGVCAGNISTADDMLAGHITALPYDVTVTDCVFSDNISPYGAALCMDAVNLTVTDSRFEANIAEYGAGVYSNVSNTLIQGTTFHQNIAGSTNAIDSGNPNPYCSGAGLYGLNSMLKVNNSIFTANESVGFGGATLVAGPAPDYTMQSFINCLFVENSAGLEGGAMAAIVASEAELINNTFVDNLVTDTSYGAGGALWCYDAFVDVTNSIFWDNLAVLGPQVAVGDPMELIQPYDPDYIPLSTVFVDYSDVQGGEEDIFLSDGTGPWVWYGPNNIDEDPLFAAISEPADVTERTFYLSEQGAGQLSTSPCVDTGVGSASTLATLLGFDITTRTDHVTDGGVINMGYHYDAAKPGKTYTLTLVVDRGSDDPLMTRLKATGTGLDPFELYSPDSRTVSAGVVVSLEAIMNDPFYTVKAWHNTDDDASTAMTNTVRMNANKTVILECETTVPLLRVTITGQGTVTTIVNGQIAPAHMTFWPKGTVVNLQATPTNPSDSVGWLNTDDDALLATTNTVTMTESKDVEVTFYTPTIYDVTGDFTEFQHAIYDAAEGDIIILHPGDYTPVHQDTWIIENKNIIIQGYNPDDPETVAATVIWGNQFIISGTNRRMVFNGITFQSASWLGADGCDGETDCNPLPDGYNGVSLSGGAMLFDGNASATVKNCRFVDCSMTGGNGGNGSAFGDGGWGGWARGGAVYIGSGNPRFINCEFTGNFVRGGAGGDAGTGEIPGRGGSWDEELNQWPDWDWEPAGGYLPYWKYSGYGGAVYCDEDSKPEFRNCLFSGNVAYGGHTGRYDTGFVEFWGNTPPGWFKIDRYGGAVYIAERSKAVFTQCNFENNQADTIGPETIYTGNGTDATTQEDPYFAYGGTIAFENDANVILNDCVFENGLAHHGGGIYAEHATLQISGSSFVGNTASFGGAVYYVDTEATVDKTLFSDNAANLPESQGGAVFAFDANSVFTDVVVNGNSSGRSGGGFFVTNGQTTVKNALIIDNSAVRDGAGFSANWYADVDLQNCTFSLNEVLGTASGVSRGGAVYAGYQSYVDIIDSILWGNSAGQGQQICVGTGFEFDPVPSIVTISYSDVQGNRSASAVFVDTGCTLNWGVDEIAADMLYADPLFVGDGSNGVNDYYLSQPSVEDPLADTSPCIDAGSDLANTLGLDKYTTAYPVPKFDMGMVDMGYHYPFEKSTDFCAYADLAYAAMGYQLDGVVGLEDLVILASHWLETQCDQTNRWCHGADLNFYNGVDFYDYVLMAGCWQAEDIEAPTPNPSQWAVTPRPVDGTLDSVEMEAVQATDNWIGGVEYYFDCLTPGGHDSGWRQGFDAERPNYDPTEQPWIYTDSGLQSDVAYTYTVKTRDVAGNETAPAQAISAIPGEDVNPPSPDPSQWAVDGQPRQTSSTSLIMETVQAVDAEGYGVEYLFVCVEDAAFSSGWRQNVDAGDAGYTATPWIYEVTGLTLGQTYTFYVKTRDRSVAQNETAPSVSVAITMAEIDEEPPTPNPAQHAFQPDSVNTGLWYQIVVAAVATDISGVEYKFVCSNSAFDSGGSQDPGPVWRNEDNVGFGTATPTYPGGLSYNGSAYQVPEAYIVQTGTHMESLLWWIYYRDRSPNQNIGRPSAKWAENGALIPEGWDLP